MFRAPPGRRDRTEYSITGNEVYCSILDTWASQVQALIHIRGNVDRASYHSDHDQGVRTDDPLLTFDREESCQPSRGRLNLGSRVLALCCMLTCDVEPVWVVGIVLFPSVVACVLSNIDKIHLWAELFACSSVYHIIPLT